MDFLKDFILAALRFLLICQCKCYLFGDRDQVHFFNADIGLLKHAGLC